MECDILGLGGSSEVADNSAATEHLRKAVEAAESAGLVATKCSALNSLGLVMYQAAGGSVEKLREAEGFLQEAFDLNTFTGDARACFQQLRNLGLVHAKLAQLSDDSDERRNFLEKALTDYQRAERFLERLPKGGATGEVLETRFRIGEVLLGLNRNDEAEEGLADVCARRKELGDWHNEARTLELLLQTTEDTAALKERAERVCEIYQAVLASADRLESFKTYPIRLANAKSIINRATSVADAQGFTKLASSLQEIHPKLDQWRSEQLNKSS